MYGEKIILILLLVILSLNRNCLTSCMAADRSFEICRTESRFYLSCSFFVPQMNGCSVKAGYFPDRDTVVQDGNDLLMANRSSNANSYEWFINDVLVSRDRDLQVHPSAGVSKIMLVATNGTCRDSIYSFVIRNGIYPDQYNSFQKRYNPAGKSMEPFCMASDKSGGYLVAANYYTGSENNFVTKSTALLHINEKGCVDWARSMTEGMQQVIQAILPTADSGFLVSAFPFQSQQDNYPNELNVFKLDKSGNKEWGHSFSNGSSVNNYFSALCQTSDGGYALEIGSFPVAGNPSFVSIVKIDRAGRFIWGRKLSVEDNAYYNIGGITEKGHFIYATGSVYQGEAPFDVIRSFLVQIDGITGQVNWSAKNDPQQGPLTFADIHHYKDSLVINSYSDKFVNDFIFLDYDGNYGSSVMVSNPYGSLNGKENITVTADNGIYFHQLSGAPGSANKEIVMRVDSNRQIAWQYDFSIHGLKTPGWYQLSPAPNNGAAGIGGGITQDGFKTLVFFKTDVSGSGCNAGSVGLRLINNPVSILPLAWTMNTALSLEVKDIPMDLKNIALESRLLCSGVFNGCDLLQLEGPARVCTVNDTVKYTLHYDPACTDAVTWTYDRRSIKLLSAEGSYLLLLFKKPGSFVIKVNKNGCNAAEDSIVVAVGDTNAVRLPRDTTICEGHTITLDAGNGYTNYTWQDGSGKSSTEVNLPGIYWVRLTDRNGCSYTDSVTIGPVRSIPFSFLPADTVICEGTSFSLRPIGSFKGYSWSNGDTTNAIKVGDPGRYTLQVVDKFGCIGNDTISINTRKCPTGIFFANAFTPNQDGLNDVFRPLLFTRPVYYHLMIYNRWGQMVFQSVDPGTGWDGRNGNEVQQAGVFIWMCTYQFRGETKNVVKGSVLLLR
jgi:gliding motility-associated-like protein